MIYLCARIIFFVKVFFFIKNNPKFQNDWDFICSYCLRREKKNILNSLGWIKQKINFNSSALSTTNPNESCLVNFDPAKF